MHPASSSSNNTWQWQLVSFCTQPSVTFPIGTFWLGTLCTPCTPVLFHLRAFAFLLPLPVQLIAQKSTPPHLLQLFAQCPLFRDAYFDDAPSICSLLIPCILLFFFKIHDYQLPTECIIFRYILIIMASCLLLLGSKAHEDRALHVSSSLKRSRLLGSTQHGTGAQSTFVGELHLDFCPVPLGYKVFKTLCIFSHLENNFPDSPCQACVI